VIQPEPDVPDDSHRDEQEQDRREGKYPIDADERLVSEREGNISSDEHPDHVDCEEMLPPESAYESSYDVPTEAARIPRMEAGGIVPWSRVP
jgi:hypothetical protein